MYCERCGNSVKGKFCAKCGSTTENATSKPKEKNPILKLIHWYVNGFMADPFLWVLGTCVIGGMILGVFSIGPCSGWMK